MASVYARGKIRWVKFYPPGCSQPSRQSLGEVDPALAELIRRKLELELQLRVPELRSVALPANVTGTFGDPAPPAPAPPVPPPPVPLSETPPVVPAAEPVSPHSPPARKVLAEYLAHIEVENSEHHVKNKTGYLKKFFGSALMDAAIKDAALKNPKKGSGKDSKKRSGMRSKRATKRAPKVSKGVFKGETLADVQVGDVRGMIDGLPLGKKTKRHYRNAFHAFFEFAMKCGHYAPTNFRYPNPMSALPSYYEKNKQIIYLTQQEIDNVLEILKPSPPVRIAAAVMIYGGLRRAETLWLTKKDLAPDLRFLSVVNKTDEEKELESSLKTGERPVPILPQLKAILEPYLKTLKSEWLCPSPRGMQWIGENFGDRHRNLLREAGLHHTCLHYRHTFATQRAAEGWSLFRISKTMGNSIAVCEKYYAAFVDPSLV